MTCALRSPLVRYLSVRARLQKSQQPAGQPTDVRVLSLITPNKPSFWFGNPLGRAVASTDGGPTPRPGYDAGESARQRLDRALTYLHGLAATSTNRRMSGR